MGMDNQRNIGNETVKKVIPEDKINIEELYNELEFQLDYQQFKSLKSLLLTSHVYDR
jgi:hypothetical protein